MRDTADTGDIDVIGDIHGQYDELHQLLLNLGYAYDEEAHCFSHPTRKVLFIGDYIDRGPKNVKSVRLVQNMVKAGSAHAIMGNHDFNAVQYATPVPGQPGKFLRKHDDKNRHQHSAFLREVDGDDELYASIIEWFKTLPVFFKQGPLHAVHACWHAAAIEALQRSGSITDEGVITPQGWLRSADKSSPDYAHFEVLLKGPEEEMAGGYSFKDPYGITRTTGRVKWWIENPRTYGEAYNLPSIANFADVPYQPSANSLSQDIREGLKKIPLLFVGHYWMRAKNPAPLSPRTACVDYSVALDDGQLTAYRYTAGETELHARNFVSVPRLG